jgi:hypothetical protein
MIRSMTLIAALTLSACAMPIVVPMPAPVLTPAPEPMSAPQSAKERFVSSVTANGCVLNSANQEIVRSDAVLSREDLGRVMTELRDEGRAAIDGDGFRITSGVCA